VGIALSDVRLRNRDTDLATAETLRVGVKLLPLLNRQVHITELVLEKPVIRIEKGADGTFNYETPTAPVKPTPKEAEAPSAPLRVAGSSVSAGKIVYVDRKEGSETSLDAIDLSVRDLSIPTARGEELLKGISFTGDLSVKEIRSKDLAVSDVRAKVTAGAGIYEIRPFTMKLFGGAGEGGIRVDLSGEKTELKVKYTLAKFRAEDPLAALAQKKYLSGPMTVTPDLSLRGKGADEMRRTLSGSVSLRGDGLTLHGMEIDEILSKTEEAQKLNLADVGAFLLAGPLGSATVKGYRYGGLYRSTTREGETRIPRLVSDWTVRDGVAEARDVAFSTGKNRIALKGKLDLVNGRFVDITVAMLDEKGCAKIRQKISGPFGDPRMDRTSVLQSFAEPILGMFEQARKLIGRTSCEPFYTGTVQHP
jgi:AsmA protein